MKKLFVLFMSTMIVVHTTIDMNIATVGAATIASSTEQLQSVDGTEQLPVQSENESQIFLSETDVELYHIGMNTTKQLESIVVGLDSNIVFTSDNEAVAKVSPYGFITAVKPGTATITATVSGASATCKVTVKDTSIKFEKSKLTMYSKGTNTVQLITIVAGESKSVTYKSNRTSVATVDKNGKVTARKAGTVIITATANGISADCEITVKAPTLTVDKKSATLYTHGTKTLKLKASTTGASKTITYKSSKPSVATIDKYGKITAVKPGTATITISAKTILSTLLVFLSLLSNFVIKARAPYLLMLCSNAEETASSSVLASRFNVLK